MATTATATVPKEPPGVHASDAAYAAPRRSTRVKEHAVSADGDTWYEKIAVCEGVGKDGQPRLLIKSCYKNSRTGERVWDEPPSGASRVQHATADMRRQAEVRLQELHWTLEMIPADAAPATTTSTNAAVSSKKKKGLFSRFKGGGKTKDKAAVEVSKDLNLQKAIARSMADQFGPAEDDLVYYTDPATTGKFDDEMAMAKALSLSEAAGRSDDDSLQRALEESKLSDSSPTTPVRAAARVSYQNSPEPTTTEESKVEHDYPHRTLSDLSEDFPSEHGSVSPPTWEDLRDAGITTTAAASTTSKTTKSPAAPRESPDRKKGRRFFGGRKSG